MTNENDIPEQTSPEAIDRYPAGTRVAFGNGKAWQQVRVSEFNLTSNTAHFFMPTIEEPLLVWVISGNAETREREKSTESWQINTVSQDMLFLSAGGEAYEFEWRRLSEKPFKVMMMTLSLSLFDDALKCTYPNKAANIQLAASVKELSGFSDKQLVSLLRALREEVQSDSTSPLFVESLGRTIALHLARQYVMFPEENRQISSLPRFKLNRIISWMEAHITADFSLNKLADMAGMSDFHFNRQFKQSTGMPPSQYLIKLRIDAAKQLLRETQDGVLDIALQVGYSNASHFARIFKKETGLSPTDFRRAR